MENLDAGKSVEGTVLGCDFVGYVESIGSRVSKLKEGDLIAGLIAGGRYPCIGCHIYPIDCVPLTLYRRAGQPRRLQRIHHRRRRPVLQNPRESRTRRSRDGAPGILSLADGPVFQIVSGHRSQNGPWRYPSRLGGERCVSHPSTIPINSCIYIYIYKTDKKPIQHA